MAAYLEESLEQGCQLLWEGLHDSWHFLQPALSEGLQPQDAGFQVNHATAGDCGRGSNSQILDFKHHSHALEIPKKKKKKVKARISQHTLVKLQSLLLLQDPPPFEQCVLHCRGLVSTGILLRLQFLNKSIMCIKWQVKGKTDRQQAAKGREMSYLCHLDYFPWTETQLLIVIQHCVHVLNPQSINWPIKHVPLPTSISSHGSPPNERGKDPICPERWEESRAWTSLFLLKFMARLPPQKAREPESYFSSCSSPADELYKGPPQSFLYWDSQPSLSGTMTTFSHQELDFMSSNYKMSSFLLTSLSSLNSKEASQVSSTCHRQFICSLQVPLFFFTTKC